MKTNTRRIMSKALGRKEDKWTARPGVLGDGMGQVDTATAEVVYVRTQAGVETALCESVPHVYDLPVWVGYLPYEGKRILRVLGQRRKASSVDVTPAILPHRHTHEWFGPGQGGGSDPVMVELRAFRPLRVYPADGLQVAVYPGFAWTGTEYVAVKNADYPDDWAPVLVDLDEQVVTTENKARFVLIAIDDSGEVTATAGSEVDMNALTLSDIPAEPAGTRYKLAAVRLYWGQSTIQEGRSDTDIVDLRSPMAHTHSGADLALDIGDLGDVTITDLGDGELLVSDSGNFVNQTLAEADIAKASDLSSHTGNTSNPHNVTAEQIGIVPTQILDDDPEDPEEGEQWVLRSIEEAGGTPVGLLLAITTPNVYSYQFCLQADGAARRADLT